MKKNMRKNLKNTSYKKNKDRKTPLLIELGVGMTPMFIQEPFFGTDKQLERCIYIIFPKFRILGFLPEFIEDKGIAILGDIGTVLKDRESKRGKCI